MKQRIFEDVLLFSATKSWSNQMCHFFWSEYGFVVEVDDSS